MTRTFLITIVSLFFCHFSASGETLDTSNLRPLESGLLLEEALKLFPKNRDPQKLDSLTVLEARGGDMSGGGTTLAYSNQRFFLDLYGENVHLNLSSCRLNSIVQPIRFLSKFNFETSCYNQAVHQVLTRTQKVAPRLHQSLVAVFKNLPFYFSSGKFRFLDENFYLDPTKEFDFRMSISTTALYVKDLGIIISLPQFLEMGETDQTGLIIHEILRSLQIQFSLKMTNADLQRIVAALFSGDEARLLNILKDSGFADFLKFEEKDQDPLLQEIRSIYSDLGRLNPELGQVEVQRLERLIKKDDMSWSFDLADALASTSSEILKYRLSVQSTITESELIRLRTFEDRFERMVGQIRARGIRGVNANALGSIVEVIGYSLNLSGRPFENCESFAAGNQICQKLSIKLKSLIN